MIATTHRSRMNQILFFGEISVPDPAEELMTLPSPEPYSWLMLKRQSTFPFPTPSTLSMSLSGCLVSLPLR